MSPPESRFARLLREVRTSFMLALPLVLGQLSAIGMNVVDTLLSGRHGPTTLAGVAVGSAIWSVVILVLIGVLMAVPASVAQLNGGNRRAEIGPLFRQALWLALALGLGLFVFVRLSGPLLTAMGIDPAVQPVAQDFLQAVSWGAPALALYFCLRYLSEGVAWTVPTMVFGLTGLTALAPLGYALMFGLGGLPALGAAGLGYATAAILWCQALGFGLYLALAPRFADLRLFAHWERPRWAPIRELLRIGLPMGVSVFMEGSLFVATALVIGTLGATEVAAHQIAINVASVAFMIPLGLAMATTVRVGHAVGAGDAPAVRWAGGAGYAIVLAAQTVSATLMWFGGGLIAAAYSRDGAVAALAANLLLYAAAFQYVDGVQALSAGALRGLKDVRIPMFITALAYWGLGMPLGAWLGLRLHWGPQGLWCGLILGLTVAALLLTVRFRRLARRPPGIAPE